MVSELNSGELIHVDTIQPTAVSCIYGWTLDVSLPHFSACDGTLLNPVICALNSEIATRWSAWTRKLHKTPVDLASLRESIKNRLEEDRTMEHIAGQEIIPLEDVLFEELATVIFQVSYEVIFPSDWLVSVKFHISQDNPQSWPCTRNEYFTFDLKSGKVVDLGDLFQDLDVAVLYLSQYCQDSLKPSMELTDGDLLKARLESSLQMTGDLKMPKSLTEVLQRYWKEIGDEDKSTPADNERVLASWRVVGATNFLNGISANPANFGNFYVAEDAIVFGFDRQQLDASVMSGFQEVRIPLFEVNHLLKSNF